MLPLALQTIADEIESLRHRLLEESASLSQRQSEWFPAPGKWSTGEVLHHLVIVEEGIGKLGSVTLKRAEASGPPPPYPHDITEFEWIPPTPDDRWTVPAPDIVVPDHGKPIVALRKALTSQAKWTAKVLQRLVDADPRSFVARHPILGDMNLAQWFRFTAYHMRVHLVQIKDIKSAPGFPKG